ECENRLYVTELREKHHQELENLTIATQPIKTLKFFVLSIFQYFKLCVLYLLGKGVWLMLLSAVVVAFVFLVPTIDGPHEKHLEEVYHYLRFGLWWIALGVASSIGLGSGLHTFVLYLGPHIALFTIKAMQCGRVDLKSAPYDTIQLDRGPSWLDKDCDEFGDPIFQSHNLLRVPLSSILPHVQIEAVLWGIGTALGELPPYFISRAARLSGSNIDSMEELEVVSSEGDGVIATRLKTIKRWLMSHAQHLNFFTILALASVPNPLFDLAGIMCGQFGIPFWKFFLSTVIGKAVIKTHIQTVFIICVCNNQLLNWVENEMIWMFSFIPGLASILPNLITKLHEMREKFLAPTPALPSTKTQVKKWDFSLAAVWNTVVWLMLLNFSFKIVSSMAQTYLKRKQEKEFTELMNQETALTQSD
ncbi:hypothetical protein LINPERHAP1_LOCUS25142, partial [Linum perenne]